VGAGRCCPAGAGARRVTGQLDTSAAPWPAPVPEAARPAGHRRAVPPVRCCPSGAGAWNRR